VIGRAVWKIRSLCRVCGDEGGVDIAVSDLYSEFVSPGGINLERPHAGHEW
jgi:hypothetical protein